MMRTLLAADLDRTLIYSRSSAAHAGTSGELVTVERVADTPMSYMLGTAVDELARLSERHEFVPVTTRTTDEFERVLIPGLNLRFAITANGGEILVEGRPCPEWRTRVTDLLAGNAPVSEIGRRLADLRDRPWVKSLLQAQGLFWRAVLELGITPPSYVAEISSRLDDTGWEAVLHARKLYITPTGLTKESALAEVVRRTRTDFVLAAGDSSLDVGMLQLAHRAIYPAHGYLEPSDVTALGVDVTRSRGIQAGAEIVQWFGSHSRLARGGAGVGLP